MPDTTDAIAGSPTDNADLLARVEALERAADGAVAFSGEGTVLAAGAGAERLFAQPRSALVGSTLAGLYHPGLRIQGATAILSYLRSEGRWSTELQIIPPDQPPRICELVIIPAPHDAAEDVLLGVFQNLTSRRDFQSRLLDTEERLRALLEGSIQGVLITRGDAILHANRALTSMFGYSLADLLKLESVDWLLAEEERPRLRAYRQSQGPRSDRHGLFEFKGIRRDGSPIWLRGLGTGITWEGAPATQLAVVDITAAKNSEAALRYHTTAAAHMADVFTVTDADGRLTTWSGSATALLGYCADDILGQPFASLIDGCQSPGLAERIEAAVRDAGQWQGQLALIGHDGTRIWFDSRFIAMRDDGGAWQGTVGVHRDISGRRAIEHRMQLHTLGLNTIHEAILFYDDQYRITELSPSAEALLGYTTAEVAGKLPLFAFPPESAARTVAEVQAALERDGTWEGDLEIIRKDGTRRLCDASMVMLGGEREPVRGMIGVLRDVTAQREAERALQESERRFRSAFDDAAIGMCLMSLDGTLQRVNQTLCDMLGYAPDELVGMKNLNLTHPDDQATDITLTREALKGLRSRTLIEKRLRHKQGHWVWVEYNGCLVRDERQQPAYMMAHIQDITQRRTNELRLQRDATVLARISEAIMVTGPDGRITEWSQGAQRMLGYTAAEVLGQTPLLFLGDEGGQAQIDALRQVVAEQGHWSGEVEMLRKDGRRIVTESTVVALYGDDGSIVGRVSVLSDITGRKREEERLRLESITFERISDGLFVTDPHYRITEWTPSAEKMFGYSAAEMVGRSPKRLLPQNLAEATAARMVRGIDEQGEWRGEISVMHKNGTPLTCVTSLTTVTDVQGRVKALVAVNNDLTEARKAEQALRDSEMRFRTAFDHAAVGMAVVSIDGFVFQVNRSLGEMLGYSTESLLEMELLELIWPEDRDAANALLRCFQSGEKETCEEEIRLGHAGGQPIFTQINASLVRDTVGNPFYALLQVLDISARVEAQQQLEAYAAELERSNRDLEDFAHVVSHDLQEPLRLVRNFATHLLEDHGAELPADAHKDLDTMLASTDRMRRLISGLLSYARVTTQAEPFEPVDLEMVMLQVMMDLKARCDEVGGSIDMDSLPTIQADPVQMHQLLQNLVSNGLKFHRPDVPPVVHVRASIVNAPGSGESQCVLTVEDNGVGFEEAYLEKVFGMFQRLHSQQEYEGTGVGMATCRKIVERHGGTITARSTLGEGSTFIVTLPLTQPSQAVN